MTARPTPEFAGKHDVDPPRVDDRVFRQGWIVRTRVDQLLASGLITRAEWQVASEYRHAWAVARELAAIEPGMIHVAGGASADDATIARLDAVTTIRIVEDLIGTTNARLLVGSVVYDLTWVAIGRFFHRDPKTVRSWTCDAIRALARLWPGLRGRADFRTPDRTRQDDTAL